MQTAIEAKPRVSYAQFVAAKRPTVSSLIAKYIAEFPDIGESPRSQLWVIARSPLGQKDATQLKFADYRDFAIARRANQIATRLHRTLAGNPLKQLSTATVGKDFSQLSVVFTHALDYWEVPVNLETLRTARRKLKKEKLISKSRKRTRRPTPDELQRLLALAAKQNDHPRTKCNMVLVIEASYEFGRRIGELVSIQRQHINIEKQTYVCYQSKQKVWHEFVLTGRAMEIAKERLAAIADEPEALLFPFNKRTCSSRYTLAKKALGIPDLRLHDNRRECFSRRFAEGYTVTQVQHGWSGHLGDAKTLQDVYTQVKPEEILAAGRVLEQLRAAAAQ